MDPGIFLRDILLRYVDSISYKGNNNTMNPMNRMNLYNLRRLRANQDNGGKIALHIRNKSTLSYMGIIPLELKLLLDKYKLHNFAKEAWSSFPKLDRHLKETLRKLGALMFPNTDTVQKQLYRSTSGKDEGSESEGGASDALENSVCSLCGVTGETVKCNDYFICSHCYIIDHTLSEIDKRFKSLCLPEYIPYLSVDTSRNFRIIKDYLKEDGAHEIKPIQNFIKLMYLKSPSEGVGIYGLLSPSLRNIDYNILNALEIQQKTIDKLTQELDDQEVAKSDTIEILGETIEMQRIRILSNKLKSERIKKLEASAKATKAAKAAKAAKSKVAAEVSVAKEAAETKLRNNDKKYQRVIITIILVMAYVWLNVIYHYHVIMDQLDQNGQYKQDRKK